MKKDKTKQLVNYFNERVELNIRYNSRTNKLECDNWIGSFNNLKKNKNFNKNIILRQILDFYFKVNDELKNK